MVNFSMSYFIILLLVFNNKLIICWGWSTAPEDGFTTYYYPISFSTRKSTLVTTDYTAVVSGTTLPPIVWVGNTSTKSAVTVYANSSFLSSGAPIYFKLIAIGY